MNKLTILFLAVGVHAFAAPTEASPVSTALVPAKLQPATGLDIARSPGQSGSDRVAPDSADAWKARFPKQPNGRLR
jgi:hypothetical protein